MTVANREWQAIAWDGLDLRVPAHWHPALIDGRGLVLEDGRQTVCALHWHWLRRRPEPRFLEQRIRKTLAGIEFTPDRTPPAGYPSGSGFQTLSYRYRGRDDQGRLLVLLAREHRFVLLAQFPDRSSAPESERDMLNSLRLQPPDHEKTWRIFDLCWRTPPQARLHNQEFLPGRFTIDFRWHGRRMTVYRFKPAGTILRGRDLAGFGQRFAGRAPVTIRRPDLVEWEQIRRGWQRLAARLGRKSPCLQFQLRHIREKNGLVGLLIQGQHPLDPAEFARLATGLDLD